VNVLVGRPPCWHAGPVASDQEVPEEDLAGAIERVKRDPEFMELLAQNVERDREILDRLAGSEHRERVRDAAERVRAAHNAALRRLGDS
jgi:hypothetical protein